MPAIKKLWDFCLSLLLTIGDKKDWGCVHSPQNRTCWANGFDIDTNYMIKAPQGKLVEVRSTE